MQFDYFYDPQSEGFSFYRIPKMLIKERRFYPLSPNTKLFYGLLLDRMGLSLKSSWYDDRGRAYVYYTITEICEDFGYSRVTAGKLLAELDKRTEIGLIERIKQGQGKYGICLTQTPLLLGVPPETLQKSVSPRNGFLYC